VSPQEASVAVKQYAGEIGWSEVGIARAENLAIESQRLREWLSCGYQGSMHWMNKTPEKRSDPRLVLPGAESVVVLAQNYFTPQRHSNNADRGKISRYAWGDDYHEILDKKLQELSSWMQQTFPEYSNKFYVDTGPVMEKAWAQRAGIGWIGKHTNLITPNFGSWVFLSVIVTTLPLEPDAPATDHCGTCTLCIDACPTDALVQPYVLDSNLCISYLTIEHRQNIGQELSSKFEGWVYGCDICQDVCPWNEKFSVPAEGQGFEPRPWNLSPKLSEWKGMTVEEFQERFSHSPIKRTKLDGVRRNAELILNNHEKTNEHVS